MSKSPAENASNESEETMQDSELSSPTSTLYMTASDSVSKSSSMDETLVTADSSSSSGRLFMPTEVADQSLQQSYVDLANDDDSVIQDASDEENDFEEDTVVQGSMQFVIVKSGSEIQAKAIEVPNKGDGNRISTEGDSSSAVDIPNKSGHKGEGDAGSEPVKEGTHITVPSVDVSSGEKQGSKGSVITSYIGPQSKSLDLPDTVTRLVTKDGNTVYLVGTAHFSLESQDDVSKTIQQTNPDIVMVELCKNRVNILKLDEETILKEAKEINFDKICSAIRQTGFVQGTMYLLLLSVSAHLTKELGMAPGGEFRRALSEAKKLNSCAIHLGDRPIHVTLQRALGSLSWWQKLKLAWHALTSKDPMSKEEVEKCKQRDMLEEMLAEIAGEFPALSRVFVDERDKYLAYSLSVAASQKIDGIRPVTVVGVVGVGHVPGIVRQWEKVREEDIAEIMKIPPASFSSKVVKVTLKASFFVLIGWGCYKVLTHSGIINPDNNPISNNLAVISKMFQSTPE